MGRDYPDPSVLGGRVGLWTSILNYLPAGRMREAAVLAEELGYGALWFGEATGREVFTGAAILLSATGRMKIATGIANIFVRDAWATNAAARTLAEAYPGRFVLGLGVSHRPLVEMRGHDYRSPLATMRSYLEDMRRARFDAVGPEREAPLLLAALGPRMLELSRELADGAHPYLVTPEHTARAREILGRGPLLAVEQGVVLCRDRAEALRLARSHLSRYLGLPNYRNSWLRQGFTEGDLAGEGSDRFVEALVAWGSEEDVRERVREHLEAGADHVCVQVITDRPERGLDREWEVLAPALLDLDG
ncbi:LLM class F420-dependent oxidoreductase [Rubrobacter xylanophilus]|uniref:LLM class F420-dependent oxidoreductase n=1 Tax=Rubrobacter xylanophilus TaxID=49319 RepID=UPI001C641013|nr:LLM class F420-dependent oxidoreductase [Rubrobacter xylanophilus]